ncbi:hypothetical protein JB92DRAFT_2840380, partial [Gautieria morchelliformis]
RQSALLALLTHQIPDSTVIRELIVTEFSSNGVFAQADLRTHFMESRCPDRGNVREFLDSLHYRSTIIKSLPPHLSTFASNLLAGAKLYSMTKTTGCSQVSWPQAR